MGCRAAQTQGIRLRHLQHHSPFDLLTLSSRPHGLTSTLLPLLVSPPDGRSACDDISQQVQRDFCLQSPYIRRCPRSTQPACLWETLIVPLRPLLRQALSVFPFFESCLDFSSFALHSGTGASPGQSFPLALSRDLVSRFKLFTA